MIPADWPRSRQSVAVSRASARPTSGDEPSPVADVSAIEAAIADLYRLANNPLVHRARAERIGTDLSRTELEALRRVDELGGGATVTAMSETLGLSLAATSRALARLENDGHLARLTDPADGRVARFELTRRGRTTRDRFQASTRSEVAHVLSGWSASDRSDLAELFGRLVRQLQGEQ